MKAKVIKDIVTSEGTGIIKAGEVIEVSQERFNTLLEIGKVEAVLEKKEEKATIKTKEQKFTPSLTKTDVVEPKDVD